MIQLFTVATTSYIPFAVSLLDTVKKHHPEFEVCICLPDYLTPEAIAENSLMRKYPIIQLHEIGAEEFDFITTKYDTAELVNASKVLFAQYLLNKENVDQLIYTDCDMLFFNRLPENVITEHEIIYTPHFSSPPPLEMKRQELEVLNAGMFNGGFFKLKKSQEATRLLKWYRERYVLDCVDDRSRGCYYDQLWINFIPLYFKSTHIEYNPGMNVAYWNLHERVISEKDGQFLVNGTTPLSFFHYSGWDYNNPLEISRWALFTSAMRPDIVPLLSKYYEGLRDNGYAAYADKPNYYTVNNKPKKQSFFKKLKRKLFKKK